MSFKRLSLRLKRRITKNLSMMSLLDDYEDAVEPPPKEGTPEKLLCERHCSTPYNGEPWRVLITGGAGHLADHLVEKLVSHTRKRIRASIGKPVAFQVTGGNDAEEDWRTTNQAFASYNIDRGIEENLPAYIQIVLVDLVEPDPRMLKLYYITFVKGSFDDIEVMPTALEGVDTVYHLAAVGMTGQYARDRKACMNINSVGTMNLLSWARNAGVKRFIYSSSIGVVFDGKSLINANERLPYPDVYYNFYCESKAHAERIVQKASTDEMKTTVLRFNGIYGPGEKRVTERVVHFIASGWWIALCKPNGIEAKTQLSSVDNCVQGLLKAELTLRHSDSPQGQIYNIMDKQPVGTFSFWSQLAREFGFADPSITIPSGAMRGFAVLCQYLADKFKVDPFVSLLEIDLLLINNTFSIAKAERELGYRPQDPPIHQIADYYRSRGICKKSPLRQYITMTHVLGMFIGLAIFYIVSNSFLWTYSIFESLFMLI